MNTKATMDQVKIIHTLVSRLKWGDDNYRAALSAYGVSSSKLLNYADAAAFIATLNELGEKAGVWKAPVSREFKKKYESLGDRGVRATGAQLRMIEAMWKDVSRQPDAERRKHALRKFVNRIVRCNDITWLEQWQVKKVIKALEAMGAVSQSVKPERPTFEVAVPPQQGDSNAHGN